MSAVAETEVTVDPNALRDAVKKKYRAAAVDPHAKYHFHTGGPLAKRLGYDAPIVDPMQDAAVESFGGAGSEKTPARSRSSATPSWPAYQRRRSTAP